MNKLDPKALREMVVEREKELEKRKNELKEKKLNDSVNSDT